MHHNITDFIKNNALKVVVKLGSGKTEIIGYKDDSVVISIGEKAENNKANIALIKFLTKELGKEVKLVKGRTGRRKIFKMV